MSEPRTDEGRAEERYGPKVRWLRIGQRMSGRELCRRVAITPSYLSDIETGRRLPAPAVSDRLADALGIDRDALWRLALLERLSGRDLAILGCEVTTPLMRAVPQRQSNTTDGDCLAAALATITGLDVPNFIESPKWHTLYRDWLAERGWTFTDDDGSRPMLGFSVAVGPSPKFPDANHATVALDGIVVWDPSPDRDQPGRTFAPRQFWPVFRAASGRPIYDPWATDEAAAEYRARMEALNGAVRDALEKDRLAAEAQQREGAGS